MSTKTKTPFDLDELTAESAELSELTTALEAAAERQAEAQGRVAQVATAQAETRRRLMATTSDGERTKARDELASLGAEAAVLPDEVTMASDSYAIALHNWAEQALAEIKLAETAEIRSAEALLEQPAIEPALPEGVNRVGETGDLAATEAVRAGRLKQTQVAALAARAEARGEKTRRLVYVKCREVFNDLRSTGHMAGPKRDRKLEGHERWLNRQREQAEERLRA